MRTLFLAALTAGLSVPALAADLADVPLRGTQYGSASEIEDWRGTYIGGAVGRTQGSFNFTGTTQELLRPFFRETTLEREYNISGLLEPGSGSANSTSFSVFAGHNVQFDEIVLGIEVDYTRTQKRLATDGSDSIGRQMGTSDGYRNNVYLAGSASGEMREFGTLRARAGYTMGAFMPFVTAGLALGHAKVGREALAFWSGYDAEPNSDPVLQPFSGSFSGENARKAWSLGLVGGVGVDVALTRNAFLRAEWQYVRFTDFAGVAVNLNTARAAAGVRF